MCIARKSPFELVRVVVVNGAPAIYWRQGQDRGIVALACDGDRIAAVYLLGNPDKLRAFP